jgi:hypothetical protein
MHRRLFWIVMFGIALLGAAGIWTVARTLREPTAIAIMRDSVQALRAESDSCRQLLDAGQAELHEYNERLDSLRGRVRELESHDPRGVPADSYAIYMGIFGQYNDSAAAWDGRVDALQDELQRCRSITESHNEAALTLRRLLLEQRQR